MKGSKIKKRKNLIVLTLQLKKLIVNKKTNKTFKNVHSKAPNRKPKIQKKGVKLAYLLLSKLSH
jgi:hypothetical protein